MSSTLEGVSKTQPAQEFEVTLELSRRGYRLFAPLYDWIFGLSLQHGRRLAVAALDCKAGEHVLEVGIGSGLSLPLYPNDVRVTGIDVSYEMLSMAMQRTSGRTVSPHTSLVQMDAECMAFADANFDKAIVLFAMAGLPKPLHAMREIKRVCRPGAKIVIANHFLSRRPLTRICDVLLAPIYRLLRYRADLDLDTFISEAALDVSDVLPANLFGYSTVLVCRNRRTDQQDHC